MFTTCSNIHNAVLSFVAPIKEKLSPRYLPNITQNSGQFNHSADNYLQRSLYEKNYRALHYN